METTLSNNDLLEYILQFTNWPTISQCSRVCRKWGDAATKIAKKLENLRTVNGLIQFCSKSTETSSLVVNFCPRVDKKILEKNIGKLLVNIVQEKKKARKERETNKDSGERKPRKLDSQFKQLMGPFIGIGSTL